MAWGFAWSGLIPCKRDCSGSPGQSKRMVPMRTMVAPSSTATSKSWLVPIERPARPRSRASVASAAKCAPAALRIGRQRRHRHQPGDRDRAAGDERVELARRDSVLARLARDVDLDEDREVRAAHGAPSSRRAESLATEWISSTCSTISLTLRDCSAPMKCQRSRPGACVDLLEQILGAVLPDEGHPGLGERLDVLGGDVLDRHEDLDAAGIAPRPRRRAVDARPDRARFARTRSTFTRATRSLPGDRWRPPRADARRVPPGRCTS